MTQALYRKYRSKRLDEIVGQRHVTEILSKALKKGMVAHAYLLTGPRGVGKTSIARILAHEINGLPYNDEAIHLDIIEIDAASNNGVEDVRDLREKIHIAPVSAKKKVYIIDEAHMLSKAAFNALLKTLEEPPEHVVFILATTNADKLPATIISRVQRFNFRTITVNDAATHLKTIATAEHIKIDDESLRLIALRGEGSFRDSIGLLDQLRSLSDKNTIITKELVETVLGLAPEMLVDQLIAAHEAKDLQRLIHLLDDSEAAGYQASVITSQLLERLRTIIINKPQLVGLLDGLLDVTKSSRPDIKLLTTLAAGAVSKPKTAALDSTALVISAPIAELSKQAAKLKPTEPKLSARKKTALLPVSADLESSVVKAPSNQKAVGIFDWQTLISYTRENHVAIYSVLSKCTYEVANETLTIYTQNSFYKKKLDDVKYRVKLLESLSATGASDVTIETIGTPPPLKNSQAAAVAAIMGGGEEVSVE